MSPAELSRTVLDAVCRAVTAGDLAGPAPTAVAVKRVRGHGHGPGCTRDGGQYATGVAFALARAAGRDPRPIAEIIVRHLADHPRIARAAVADPGFVNLTLAGSAYADLLRTVRERGPRYGHSTALADQPPVTGDPATLSGEDGPRTPAEGDGLRALSGEDGPRTSAREGGLRALSGDDGPRTPAGDDCPRTPAREDAPRTVSHNPRAAANRRLLRACGGAPPNDGVDPIVADPRLGPDATAWAYVRPQRGEAPDLDPGRHLPQRVANPLFRIRYAYARTRALARNAGELGFGPVPGDYAHPAEIGLLTAIADYPGVVEAAARRAAPDRLARALEGMADAFFDLHDNCPVLPRGDEEPTTVHRARLALADATGTVLAGGLTLLGITAPDHL